MTAAVIGAEALSVDVIKEQSCETSPNKPCGHAETFADFEQDGVTVCYECVASLQIAEKSRRKLDRRRTAAGLLLRWKSPVPPAAGIGHNGGPALVEDEAKQKRGKWFPVSACGIVPWGPGMSLEHRLSGRVDRHGVFRCGSIWTCPCCAQRVSVARSKEVRLIIEAAREKGYRVAMVTYTAPHDKCLPLATSIARFRDAMSRYTVQGTLRDRRKELGYIGHLVAMEITLALDEDRHDNGWHVHFHALEVYEGAGETTRQEDAAWAAEVKRAIFDPWKSSMLLAGSPRPPSFKHGVDVKAVWSATDYPVKSPVEAEKKKEEGKKRWGAENEMTKGYIKERSEKAQSRTPFQLLDSGDRRDEELFLEYARATFGRRQLEWSRGDRDLRRIFLGKVDKRTDEQLAMQEPEYELPDDDKPTEPDFVIERVDIASDDAWRGRRYSRGSMDRACRDAEDGELSLSEALRQQGWLIDVVAEARTDMEHVYDEETGDMLFEEVFLYAQPAVIDFVYDDNGEYVFDPDGKPLREVVCPGDDFETGIHWRPVMKPIHVPRKVVASFPARSRDQAAGKNP